MKILAYLLFLIALNKSAAASDSFDLLGFKCNPSQKSADASALVLAQVGQIHHKNVSDRKPETTLGYVGSDIKLIKPSVIWRAGKKISITDSAAFGYFCNRYNQPEPRCKIVMDGDREFPEAKKSYLFLVEHSDSKWEVVGFSLVSGRSIMSLKSEYGKKFDAIKCDSK